ncbi:hypothetical protein [Paracidovorax sp. MALMAid1276]|uniref:hypothetical protein n=1 Tax=Paracidovorax sp. MALMAid1276 TaxID=3411631 RepID=UPI003B994F82
MGPLDILNHLLNFAAPAAFMAAWSVLLGRFIRSKSPLALSWWAQAAIVFIVCIAVTAGGLLLWGRDGRMLTYGALVLAAATCQWGLVRGWRA